MTVVRDATPDDARAIAAVHVHSWQDGYRDLMPAELLDGLSVDHRERAWRELLDGGDARMLVAEVDDSVAGFAAFVHRSRDDDAADGTAEIAALYVDPTCWRRGVATALLREALVRLSLSGAEEVTVWVLDGNAAGIAFYEEARFGADGARTPHEPSGREQHRYRVRLTR